MFSTLSVTKTSMDPPHRPSSLPNKLLFLFLLLSTNLLTLFISTTFYSSCSLNPPPAIATFTAAAAANTTATNTAAANTTAANTVAVDSAPEEDGVLLPDNPQTTLDLPPEFIAFISAQELPFGFSSNFDSDRIFPPSGRPCTYFPDELHLFMSYKVNGSCPDDELLAQKLLLRGCEPLPRRRCRPAAPQNYAEPYPLPASLWTTPPDSSVVWTAYNCKNYGCLINRSRNQKGFDDCKDCFDLEGREETRWAQADTGSDLDFSIDEVLAVKNPGTIRIGLDIGGGVATFAVRMRERNITIITTSMNLNGPFNSFIASRGMVPLYISISQRLPFFDNTLDIVHSMHVLSNWIPTTLLHFLFFDIYRVLRPGGLFWLDHFFCVGEQFKEVYAPLIESIGFEKVKWVVGPKLDRGPELREMYLSALLQKPLNNSW